VKPFAVAEEVVRIGFVKVVPRLPSAPIGVIDQQTKKVLYQCLAGLSL
jgi:hypothetical protein